MPIIKKIDASLSYADYYIEALFSIERTIKLNCLSPLVKVNIASSGLDADFSLIQVI